MTSKTSLQSSTSTISIQESESNTPRHRYNTRSSTGRTPNSNALRSCRPTNDRSDISEEDSSTESATTITTAVINALRCINSRQEGGDPDLNSSRRGCGGRAGSPEMESYDACTRSARRGGRRGCSNLYTILVAGGSMILLLSFCYLAVSLRQTNMKLENITEQMKLLQEERINQTRDADKMCMSPKHYLKDPVGRPDFALYSSGGRVVNILDTVSMFPNERFLGFSLCENEHGPTTMIRVTTAPGECWPFKGQFGKAVIELIGFVQIDAVSLEHIPSTLSPTGNINNAPKDFAIWGLKDPSVRKRTLLGEFTYDINGDPVQTFPVKNNTCWFQYVEFVVASNWGNPDFTCIYRLRVHGTLGK